MKTGKIDSTSGMIRLNSPASAVQQREGAAGDVLPDQPGGLSCARSSATRNTTARLPGPASPAAAPYENDGGTAVHEGYNPKKAMQLLKEARLRGRADHRAAGDRPRHHHAGHPGAGPGDAAGRHQRRGRSRWTGARVVSAARQEGAAGRRAAGTSSSPPRAASARRNPYCTPGWRGLRQGPVRLAVRSRRSRSCATPSAWPRDEDERKKIAKELQTQAMEDSCPPFGQWDTPLAYRADKIDGIVPNTGLAVLWGITKK